jgi:hypothetical protein
MRECWHTRDFNSDCIHPVVLTNTRGCCVVGKEMIGNERGSVLHQLGGNEENLRQDSEHPAEGRNRPCQEHYRLKQLDC